MEVIGSSVGLVSVNALVLIEPINSERSTIGSAKLALLVKVSLAADGRDENVVQT